MRPINTAFKDHGPHSRPPRCKIEQAGIEHCRLQIPLFTQGDARAVTGVVRALDGKTPLATSAQVLREDIDVAANVASIILEKVPSSLEARPQARGALPTLAAAWQPSRGAFALTPVNLIANWRRRRDSNPGYRFRVRSLSKGVPSATRPRLQSAPA